MHSDETKTNYFRGGRGRPISTTTSSRRSYSRDNSRSNSLVRGDSSRENSFTRGESRLSRFVVVTLRFTLNSYLQMNFPNAMRLSVLAVLD